VGPRIPCRGGQVATHQTKGKQKKSTFGENKPKKGGLTNLSEETKDSQGTAHLSSLLKRLLVMVHRRRILEKKRALATKTRAGKKARGGGQTFGRGEQECWATVLENGGNSGGKGGGPISGKTNPCAREKRWVGS